MEVTATGLGIHAVNQGYQVSYVPMGHLVYILKTPEYISKSRTRYKRMAASDLIIIADIMYMAYEPQDAQLFFQFIYDMYDKTAFILSMNMGPQRMGAISGRYNIHHGDLESPPP